MTANGYLALALAGAIACASCSGDGDGDAGGGSAMGGAGQGGDGASGASPAGAGGGGADPCTSGCVHTLAADCDNGPASASECVSDCQALMNGSCGAEYRALQACAEGEAVACDAQGIPAIEACAAEQAAFVACLS